MSALQINLVLSTTSVSFFVVDDDVDVDDDVVDDVVDGIFGFEIGDDDITTSCSLFISKIPTTHKNDS